MGGRGNLSSARFAYTSKTDVFNALKDNNIRLTKDGKPIKDASGITNKELSTLSALAELSELKHIKVIDISNKRSEPMVGVYQKHKVDGQVVKIPTLRVNKDLARKGVKQFNKTLKEQGYANGMKDYKLKRNETSKVKKKKNGTTVKKTQETKPKLTGQDAMAYFESLLAKGGK